MVKTLFIDFSDAQGQLTPKSVMESCRNSNSSKVFMVGLVTCKNETDPSKSEDARVFTTFFIDFSDAQGQLTPKSVIEPCRKSN